VSEGAVVPSHRAGAPDLRSLTGLVCPSCRHHAPELSESSREIWRCPRDGFAMVAPRVLADADGDPFLGATIAGRYVILGKIGAGSTGTVYRGRDVVEGRGVAVKIVRGDREMGAQAAARLEREARVLSMLRSPHTVRMLDAGVIAEEGEGAHFGRGPSFYLVMELLVGEPLGQRLRRAGRLSVAEAKRLATHMLVSLAEAHEAGFVHRDLKPDNVFIARVDGGGEIGKLLDFGLAKSSLDDCSEAQYTKNVSFVGTPKYMSPEQIRGECLDGRSDVYAVGVLLYQMLVGEPPFGEGDAARVMMRHLGERPTPPCEAAPEAGIPKELSELVLRAMSKRPEERPESAHAMLSALEATPVVPRSS